jgi:2-polyprenyl-3-methyl-5-hydroxy-6-metoxy-1,4-benzoquinol methylase
MEDSKQLWTSLQRQIPRHVIQLGAAVANAYVNDPKHIAFIASRYKFVSKMLEGMDAVIEVGCGDAFGAPIVAQTVGKLLCTDIDRETLEDNKARLEVFKNIEFGYFDFRETAFHTPASALYSVDVLEHVFPSEEEGFLRNLARSLKPNGVAVIGTPNLASDRYASKWSKDGHVNLKDHAALRSCLQKHFQNVFMFSMNDEVVHTGFYPMAHYLWALCVSPEIL